MLFFPQYAELLNTVLFYKRCTINTSLIIAMALANVQNSFFNLELHCTKTSAVDQKQIEFASLPKTVRDVKMKIENNYNIPVCTQTLSFESQVLSDDTNLECVRIRSGDTFRVSYYADGNCAEILKVIGWFKVLLAALRVENPSISEGISFELERLLAMGLEEKHMDNLAFEYFDPWLDARTYVNKLHFVHNDGVEVIMSIYSLLFRHPWPNCRLKLKYLERDILTVLGNLSETFALRRLITKHNGLQLCMKSLLRKKLEEGQPIKDRETPGHQVMHQDWILTSNLMVALGTLCKYVWSGNGHVIN